MIKLLTGGGFGDAAMSIGKLYSKDAPFNHPLEFNLTHVEVGNTLLPAISDFYKTQGIKANVFEIDNWDVKETIRSKYDYYLGTHWSENNIGDESSWEINPFPPLIYDKVETGTVVNVSSGRRDKFRGFTKEEIIQLDNQYNNLIFIGKSNDEFFNRYNFNNNNLVNKTTVKQLVDVVCSCDVYIGFAGFALFLAGLANKDIYGFRDAGDGWEYRVHPSWRVNQVKGIQDIV
tara:strand:- start:3853 stop:4548 length:696 start_codon:yes stop_codon:yes gene_type:complete